VGLVCGVTIGVLALISAAATDGVRIGLAERSGTDIAYRVSFRLAHLFTEDLEAVAERLEEVCAHKSRPQRVLAPT
jgi:precorrin-4 methylase